MRWWGIPIWGVAAFTLACSGDRSSEQQKAAPVAERTPEEVVEELVSEAHSFNIARYEALLVGLAECPVQTGGVARDCPGWEAFEAERDARRSLLRRKSAEVAALGRKHLAHPSPAVRLQAARLASSLFGADSTSRDALVAAARAEKDPHVLKAMLRAVRSSIARSDAVRDLLVSMATHADPQVRITALGALSASWARDTEGTLEAVMKAVADDPSTQVRQYACRQLGDRADPRAMPLLEARTEGPGDDPKLYAACFRGLIGMWAAPVPHEAPHEAAYRLTLARLNATPRDEQQPPWAAIPNLEWAAKPELAKRAAWYDPAELIAALEALTVDRKAHWLARTGAIKTLRRLGASDAVFGRLQAAYADAAEGTGVDKQVHTALVEEMQRRGSPDGAGAAQDPAAGGKAPAQGDKAPAQGGKAPAQGDKAPAKGGTASAQGDKASAKGSKAP